jgi:hypothetical protein
VEKSNLDEQNVTGCGHCHRWIDHNYEKYRHPNELCHVSTVNKKNDNCTFVMGHFSIRNSLNNLDQASVVTDEARSMDHAVPSIPSAVGNNSGFTVEIKRDADSTYKFNHEDENLDEIETLLLRDQLLRSLTMKHQQRPDESTVLQVNEPFLN